MIMMVPEIACFGWWFVGRYFAVIMFLLDTGRMLRFAYVILLVLHFSLFNFLKDGDGVDSDGDGDGDGDGGDSDGDIIINFYLNR